MDKGNIKKEIYSKLSELHYKKGIKDIVELFTKYLNYKYQNLDIPKEIFPEETKKRILEIKIIAEHNDFKIFFIHLDLEKLTKTIQREIIKKLETYGFPFALFVFSNEKNPRTIHFVNVKYEEKSEEREKIIRRMIIEDGGGFRTYSERLSLIEIDDENLTPLKIQAKHNEAFDVDKVTEEFFNRFKNILEEIIEYLSKFNIDEEKGRHFTIQFLNRMIFIYFIQKKGWIFWEKDRSDKKFLYNLYIKYKKEYKTKNSNFYRDFLEPLFFYAFNQNSGFKNLPLPYEIKISYSYMPYLNGGLFTKNKYDEIGDVLLQDNFFDKIFDNLLERFNFIITEDLPFDIEVAVDPEMLGKVYESLVHGEEIQERRKVGIFFTPRVEIDYMTKMSLVENMYNNLGIEKEKLINFVYSNDTNIDLNEKEKFKIREYLKNIKIVDPAVGSGSFLVRAMNILVDLLIKTGYETDRFNLRKNIIKNSLYGVDVMEWAVRIAELRLWLNLIIDLDKEDADIYTKPLLPNLSFKIRQGDSLVQEIFGNYISLRKPEYLTSSIKKIIDELAEEHDKFFDGKSERESMIKKLENYLIKTIFDEKVKLLKNKKTDIQKKLEKTFEDYSNLIKNFGENKKDKEEFEKKFDSFKKEKEKIETEIEEFGKIYEKYLKSKEKTFFLWDVCFSNVFKEKNGFDIVIGNPPYVRQELIAPPLEKQKNYTSENWRKLKQQYKEKLIQSTQNLWPEIKNIDKKSDLYIYFYYHGLSLLNDKGTFCFINSSSWLDVGYGAGLQEFLLKNMKPIYIIDNLAKRTFKQADVNTVIVLIQKPEKKLDDFTIKFVAFKKLFEEVISPTVMKEIEEANKPVFDNEIYRIYPKTKMELLKEGVEYPEETDLKFQHNLEYLPYIGNKWGGKYLRAPEIYFKILEKGKDKLVRLGDIAEVRRGFTTGANEFFYLKPVNKTVKEVVEIAEKEPQALIRIKNGAGWEGEIEAEFLKPMIKSPRELKTIVVKIENLNYLVFMCHKNKKEIKDTKALEYIEWGEEQGIHKRPTCASRQIWWDLGIWEISKNILPMFERERKYGFYNQANAYIDAALYWVYKKININEIVLNLLLNSSLIALWKELLCRPPEGGGGGPIQMKVYHYNEMPIIPLEKLKIQNINIKEIYLNYEKKEIPTIFIEYSFDPNKSIHEQEPNPLPDRKALDDIVFDALDLTEEEQKEVYWAVAELVQNRLKKAKSL